MKETLDLTLRQFLERLEKTEKFVLEQAPDLCKEMVLHEKINLISNFFTCTIIFVVLLSIDIHCLNIIYSTEHEMFGYSLTAILSSLFAFVTLVFIVESIQRLYQLRNCTKLFLLKEFRDLVSGDD